MGNLHFSWASNRHTISNTIRLFYYSESHVQFRKAVKDFVQREIAPDAGRYDEAGDAPSKELYKKMGSVGILAARM